MHSDSNFEFEHHDFTTILPIFLQLNRDFAEFILWFSCSPNYEYNMHNSHNKVRNLQLNMLHYHASNNSGVDFHFASNVTVMCFVLAGENRTVIRNSSDKPTYWRLFILSTILQTNRPSCNICYNVSLYHRKDQTVLSNSKVLASVIWRRSTSHSADMWQKEIDKVICLSVNFHSSVNSARSSNDIYLSYK